VQQTLRVTFLLPVDDNNIDSFVLLTFQLDPADGQAAMVVTIPFKHFWIVF
jgi:hypothetical protein